MKIWKLVMSDSNGTYIVNALSTVGLFCLLMLSQAANAQTETAPKQPQYDVAVPEATNILPSNPLLYGSVAKKHSVLDNSSQNQLSVQQKDLQTGSPQNGVFQIAIQKLSQRIKLSSEEYRSLGVGVTGCEIYQPFFQDIGYVQKVYEDSPADLAGIKVGEKVVLERDAKTDAMAKANPSQPLYQATFAREGTTIELTLLRHRKPVKISLVRMNIEDIKDARYRIMWEDLISKLGQPEGKFVGTSLESLEQN